MTKTQIQAIALDLPREDRRDLAETLWKSLETTASDTPEWQRQLVAQRLQDLADSPENGSTWEEVEQRLWGPR